MTTINGTDVTQGVPDLDALWRPIDIGNVEIKNRILLPAHGVQYAREVGGGLLNARYVRYLERRAEGGVGMIVTAASPIDPRYPSPGGVHLFDDRNIPLAQDLTARIHRHGAKIFTQLYHAGYHDDNSEYLDWAVPLGASALPSPSLSRTAHAMSPDEIAEIVEYYGRGAAKARESGYDGVELSAGHGYIISQFLSPVANRREDRYGGSLHNRMRFAFEVAESVRRHAGADYPLGVRMSYDEHLGPAGITPDLSDEHVREFGRSGLFAYVSVSGGNYHTVNEMISPSSSGRVAFRVDNAARAKAIVGDAMPVMVAGNIRTVQVAAAVLASGSADMVAMARAHIADPDVVAKAQSGRSSETRNCIGSNNCWKRAISGKHVSCTVNPQMGREDQWPDGEEVESRAVVVVGGGPAGLKAAVVAAERGHRVTLLERHPELGGQLRHMRVLPGRGYWFTLIRDLSAAADRLGVDVRLNSEATPEVVAALAPDHVIVATGARFDRSGYSGLLPFQVDGIPGASADTVLDPISVLENPSQVGKRVVIMEDTGDYVGLGVATLLAEDDHEVELVTPHTHAGSKLYAANEAPYVVGRAVRAGVRITTSAFISDVSAGSVMVSSTFGGEPRRVDVDSVVLAMMRIQDDGLAKVLVGADTPTHVVGDCMYPADVDQATHGAEKAARLIE